MSDVPDAVSQLAGDLHQIFGARLQSLVLYGRGNHASTTTDHDAHGHGPVFLRTLALVDVLTVADLKTCASRTAVWHDRGLATPLVLPAGELERSLDVFPLEFGAIEHDHVLIAGVDPFTRARVEPNDLRRACEVQARSHLLHLREGYLETRGNADALAVLIVDSAPALAALLASVARLEGVSASDPGAVGRHAERRLEVPGGSVAEIIALSKVREISAADAVRLFPGYLAAIERLVQYADGWSRA